jgi:hypothetical protein
LSPLVAQKRTPFFGKPKFRRRGKVAGRMSSEALSLAIHGKEDSSPQQLHDLAVLLEDVLKFAVFVRHIGFFIEGY